MSYELKNKDHHEMVGLDLFEELMSKEAAKSQFGKRLLGSKMKAGTVGHLVGGLSSHPFRRVPPLRRTGRKLSKEELQAFKDAILKAR
tara:strand:- start:54 stop:317 length:264 start_codon:yes stop_codon:yes gene_type:complete